MTDTTTPDQGDERRAAMLNVIREVCAKHQFQSRDFADDMVAALSAAQPVAQEAIRIGALGTAEIYKAQALAAPQPSQTESAVRDEQAIIARFLERTGQYVTNDASREAAIKEATASAEAKGWRGALELYANGSHFTPSDPSPWESVSGEPSNFLEDEANTATVEDGEVARAALMGYPLQNEDGTPYELGSAPQEAGKVEAVAEAVRICETLDRACNEGPKCLGCPDGPKPHPSPQALSYDSLFIMIRAFGYTTRDQTHDIVEAILAAAGGSEK